MEPRPVRPASIGADAAQPTGAGAMAWPRLAGAGGCAWRTRRLPEAQPSPEAQPRVMGPSEGHGASPGPSDLSTHSLTHLLISGTLSRATSCGRGARAPSCAARWSRCSPATPTPTPTLTPHPHPNPTLAGGHRRAWRVLPGRTPTPNPHLTPNPNRWSRASMGSVIRAGASKSTTRSRAPSPCAGSTVAGSAVSTMWQPMR